MCKHKNEGGWDLEIFTSSTLLCWGKLAWRLHTQPCSLVNRILKARYFSRSNFFDARLGNNPSYTWKGIHTAIDLVKYGARWKVGEGGQVCMLGNPWLDNDRSFFSESTPILTFEDIVIRDFYIPGTRLWDTSLIQEVFPEYDIEQVLKITPSPEGSRIRRYDIVALTIIIQ